jgi:signal transduction protein with GAF and PtsI domain
MTLTEHHTASLTPEQLRAVDLLELNPDRLPVVVLTDGQWRHVQRVVTTLGALGIPAPRQAVDEMAGQQ